MDPAATATQSVEHVELEHPPDLAWLRSSLNLSMSELADFFGAPRKLIYDWLDGSLPMDAARARLAVHARMALSRALPAERLVWLRQVWQKPLADGSTMKGRLQALDPLVFVVSGALELSDALSELERRAARPAKPDRGRARCEDLFRGL